MQCLELPVPANGNIIYDKERDPSYMFGTEAVYQCEQGYRLVFGDERRLCQMDGLDTTGSWSGVEPICESKFKDTAFINDLFGKRVQASVV